MMLIVHKKGTQSFLYFNSLVFLLPPVSPVLKTLNDFCTRWTDLTGVVGLHTAQRRCFFTFFSSFSFFWTQVSELSKFYFWVKSTRLNCFVFSVKSQKNTTGIFQNTETVTTAKGNTAMVFFHQLTSLRSIYSLLL